MSVSHTVATLDTMSDLRSACWDFSRQTQCKDISMSLRPAKGVRKGCEWALAHVLPRVDPRPRSEWLAHTHTSCVTARHRSEALGPCAH